ncbi:PREDICTED: tRNA pseudouridine(38/39) synthase [Cyprinodon variegatus]|uniref:Pseudouridylate synthase 3 n=1 Tax=Cyprinodon variegatus TaxID=28743 RepID=A0A3Q2EIP1_CYPVA|nr:PREDICTED: tRNA pseudouridine(38/39) synthase [Cyprinodon variegatus]XP_015237974.1 PREDICTED: tRNA pseudouridine(38/39) synthase [Cyprinodon variegatus]XP_015237982.1 PREDICTED: tRNA pseudouridine(38/39) synthase [Cyprinodon variegatus]
MSDALIQKIKELEDELEKLRSQLGQTTRAGEDLGMMSCSPPSESPDCTMSDRSSRKRSGKQRPFDFSSHPRRHVALKLAYLGWSYQGFAVQENTDNTVEARLFEALLKTRLIQDRQSSNYHRCGRTDKGVSAFSQVITIDLRSTQFCGGLGVSLPESLDLTAKSKESTSELPYVKMLNRVLPQDIQILDWAPVEQGFSARFDCQSRTYRYYFPRGFLDVELMANAAKKYEGTHDFRNLCKMDVGNGVLQFERTILSASVRPAHPRVVSSTDQHEVFVFEVKGLAFLYHQVRCMMAVLLLIGQKLEAPEIIDELLDVKNNPRKPQYSMAVDYPLVLYDCHFEGLSWQQETEEVNHVLSSLQRHWTQSAVKAHLLLGMIQGLEERGGVSSDHCWLLEGSRQKNYRPLMQRPCCESLESRINHFVKRGRLEREEGENGDEMIYRGKKSKNSYDARPPSVSSEIPKQSFDQKEED